MSSVEPRIFNAIAVLSAVLLSLAVAIWIVSLWGMQSYSWGSAQKLYTVGADGGRFIVEKRVGGARFSGGWDVCGVSYRTYGKTGWNLGISFTHLALVMLPTQWLLRKLRQRRTDATWQLCERCGYDLRATPERCPECGTQSTQANPQPAEGATA